MSGIKAAVATELDAPLEGFEADDVGLEADEVGLEADELGLGVAERLADSVGLVVAVGAGGLVVGSAKATPTADVMASPVASTVAPASRPVMDVLMMTPKV